ncbi:hypothetical protein ONZ45_g2769 [Pleurotus djamor]|nr:hypothetical protein ONZ45_g2769 [Pleurotus djamor]
MDALIKEIDKLEKLTTQNAKGKGPSMLDSLDSLISTLRAAKHQCESGEIPSVVISQLPKSVEACKKDVDDRHKEVYSSLSRFGKGLDKKFSNSLPSYSDLFTSSSSVAALERTIAIHFLRAGQFDLAQTFLEESDVEISTELRSQFVGLHQILKALQDHDISPALEWVEQRRDFLRERSSPLEFCLHRSEYIRLLLSNHPPDPRPAIAYANAKLRPFYKHHEVEFFRLLGCVAFLPLSRLQRSPYADLASPSLHFELGPLFAKEYCASLGMSRQLPLRVVGDIGGGGALARIEKGRKVMRERKSEWSQTDELPIEIAVPPENRYHSIFACPVSKEQSSKDNPPMMMACGHVLTQDSLSKLNKPAGVRSRVRHGQVFCLAHWHARLTQTLPTLSVYSRASRCVGDLDMLDFNPTRSSPEPKRVVRQPRRVAPTSASSTVSRASTLAVPELSNLLPEDVELLDAVLERAGPNATSFITVFKAYNDILQQRGLDPTEVVYYGKILKLGNVKGVNWQDKWLEVKRQNGFPRKPPAIGPTKKSFAPLPRDDESYTLFSTDNGRTASKYPEMESRMSRDQARRPLRDLCRSPSPVPSAIASDVTEDHITKLQDFPLLMPPVQLRPSSKLGPPNRQSWQREDPLKHKTVTDTPRSSMPSRTGHNPLLPSRPITSKLGEHALPKDPHERALVAKQAVARARQVKSSVVNDEDAWKNIEMQRNEEEAHRFYIDKLLERYWDAWKQNYDWIITTNDQISEARDNIIIQTHLQRWRDRTAARIHAYTRVAAISNQRCLRHMFDLWKAKLKVKKQQQWRHDMRMKMKLVRESREANLIKVSWLKWRQSMQSRVADEHYRKRILSIYLKRWRNGLGILDDLDGLADEANKSSDLRVLKSNWHRWRRALQLRFAEKSIEDAISVRLMDQCMTRWKRRICTSRKAEAFHDNIILRGALRSWKAARTRLKNLDNRADKHVHRQDDILLRAVMRVWKARERGQLLQRVKSMRILRKGWVDWMRAVDIQRQREAQADAFSRRLTSYDAKSALIKWRRSIVNLRSTEDLADQHYIRSVYHTSFQAWRAHLREKLKLQRQARMVEKHLTVRRAWTRWQEKLAEKRREKRLRAFATKQLQTSFHQWLYRARKARNYRLAEEAMVTSINLVMSRWTTRVVDIKLKEIEVTQRRDNMLMSNAFGKWKTVCIRHVEELNLMESYQYVKQEETVKRVFNRWLSAARASRHRRLLLQKKEYQMKLSTISVVWDKWIDRFKAARLKPVEQDVMAQMQRNLLFRAFGIWHAKTMSLPAIRFHASSTKVKYWQKWRAEMPRAMLAKAARDKHRQTVLAVYLDKWVQVYRTKMALKAVAPSPAVPSRSVAKQTQDDQTTDDSDGESVAEEPQRNPYVARKGIAKLLSTERQTSASPRGLFLKPREASPSRSAVSSRHTRSIRGVSPARSKTPFSDAKEPFALQQLSTISSSAKKPYAPIPSEMSSEDFQRQSSDDFRSRHQADEPQSHARTDYSDLWSPIRTEIPSSGLDFSFDTLDNAESKPVQEKVEKRASNVMKLTQEHEKLKAELKAMTDRLQAAENRRKELEAEKARRRDERR